MTCYLQLTLADAERIIRENDRRYWAEARVLMNRASAFVGDDPDYYLATFVRATTLPPAVRAGRGQLVCIMCPKGRSHQVWGTPLDGDEPMLRAMRLEHLKSKVGQPQARKAKDFVDNLPLFTKSPRSSSGRGLKQP